MLNFEYYLEITEGKNDPAIFKAIFLAGGPGSGKSFIANKAALSSMGFKIVNSDQAFEHGMKKAKMELDAESVFSARGQEIRGKASVITSKREGLYIAGRLGLVLDGTGKDYNKIKTRVQNLEDLGYETAMIFVNTTLDTAIARDQKRDRTVGPSAVTDMWSQVQKNMGKYQSLFGRKNFFVVDNNTGSNIDKRTLEVYKQISRWAKRPPRSPEARKWLEAQ